MKNIPWLALIAALCCWSTMPAHAQADGVIAVGSVGKVKLGMTVAEVRRAVKPMTLSRTSDGEGVALIAVKQGKEQVLTLYAGEENPEAKLKETAKIEVIEVWSKSFKTADGVHVGMPLSEVESKFGKLKEISLSEIESREFATFAKQPAELSIRVAGKDSSAAGNYGKDERTSSSCTEGAYVLSISLSKKVEAPKE